MWFGALRMRLNKFVSVTVWRLAEPVGEQAVWCVVPVWL